MFEVFILIHTELIIDHLPEPCIFPNNALWYKIGERKCFLTSLKQAQDHSNRPRGCWDILSQRGGKFSKSADQNKRAEMACLVAQSQVGSLQTILRARNLACAQQVLVTCFLFADFVYCQVGILQRYGMPGLIHSECQPVLVQQCKSAVAANWDWKLMRNAKSRVEKHQRSQKQTSLSAMKNGVISATI